MADSLALENAHATNVRSRVEKPSISLFFPAYNDGFVIETLTEKAVRILSEIASRYEIIIVNDGSKDDTGAIADRLASRFDAVRVIHHPTNLGYGKALQSGFNEVSDMDWICFTDGDHQYDISEIRKFARLLDRYDAIVGFRVDKVYSPLRKFLSWGLNRLVRMTFGTRLRDVTCGFKMIRRSAVGTPHLVSNSPFAGAEVAVRSALNGLAIGEVAISMYPRQYGGSNIVTFRAVRATFRDVRAVYRDLFRNQPRGS